MSLDTSLIEDNRRLISTEEGSVIGVYDAKHNAMFYIDERFWINFSWPLELARRIVTFKHTIMCFDIIYIGMLIFYFVSYVKFYSDTFDHHYFTFNGGGDGLFFIFFVVETILNACAPPLTMRLMRDMFTDESVPTLIETVMECDKYFRLKMCVISYVNAIGILTIVLLSVSVIDFYEESTLPFIIMSAFPLACVVSVVVVVLDAYRLLQMDFIKHMQILTSETESARNQYRHSFSNQTSLDTVEFHSRETLIAHVIRIRVRFLALHKELYSAGQRWGPTLLLLTTGLAMYAGYLVILAYKLEDISIAPLMPYVMMALVALFEIVVELTLVNETGTRVKKELAKHVLEYAGNKALACDCQDIMVLLSCAQTLPLEIHFVEGFSLKFRLAAAILGPIVFAMLPRLITSL